MNRLIMFALLAAIALAGAIKFPVLSHGLLGNAAAPPTRVKAVSDIGAKLNPSSEAPASGFKAIYYERQSPERVVFEETVPNIAIRYAWSEFHGIDSPNFAAYWVGKLSFAAPAIKQISVSQSWAQTRIYIDGKVVFQNANQKQAFTYRFEPGDHVVEVEFANAWHTVEYKVTIDDVVELSTAASLSSFFRQYKMNAPELYYVGLYESAASDLTVDVAMPDTKTPVVLWLDSYGPIDWNITSKNKIAAVVVASYSPGSRAIGATTDHSFKTKDWIGVHAEGKRCACNGGSFYCENKIDLFDVANKLTDITGLKLSGYAMNYKAEAVTIAPFDDAARSLVQKTRLATSDIQNTCKK